MLAVQRAEAGLSGELGEVTARIADAKERIARAEQQIAQVRSAAMQKAIEELRATETELDDVQEQSRAAQDVVDRIEVRAPVRGIVVKLHQHTLAASSQRAPSSSSCFRSTTSYHRGPRQPQRDLARQGEPASARETHGPQPARDAHDRGQSHLSVGRCRRPPSSSPHRKASAKRPHSPSYVVRVRLDEQERTGKSTTSDATPGMPADVFIKTGERTFSRLHHAAGPRQLLDSAFREH